MNFYCILSNCICRCSMMDLSLIFFNPGFQIVKSLGDDNPSCTVLKLKMLQLFQSFYHWTLIMTSELHFELFFFFFGGGGRFNVYLENITIHGIKERGLILVNLPKTTGRRALFTSHSRQSNGPMSILNSWSTCLRL